MKFIVDANIAIKWLMAEPDSATAIDLLDHTLLAPELLLPECLNVLWRKRVKQELTAEEAAVALTALAAAQIEWLPVTPLMPAILDLATRLNHPAYDCTYLAAAMRSGVPMVTADSRFVRRCRQADAKDLAPFIRLLGEPVAGAEH